MSGVKAQSGETLPRHTTLVVAMIAFTTLCIGCMRSLPDTHYYALVPPRPVEVESNGISDSRVTIAVQQIETDATYADDRIVYRTSPFRFGYYEYHRWSAPPSTHLADYLQTALARTGHFARVSGELADDATVVVGGRLMAFEEVDLTETEWIGRVELELHVEHMRTRELLWTRTFREEAPLANRTPEALAHTLSLLMARIVHEAAPAIAEVAEAARTSGPGWDSGQDEPWQDDIRQDEIEQDAEPL